MSAKLVETCAVRLKKALDMRNMRATELCEKTNVPKSAISHYLKGSFVPKQDRAYILAKALNVNPAWLMGFDAPVEIEEEKTKEKDLSNEELLMLKLFRQIPGDRKKEALQLLEVALKMQQKP